MLMCFYLFIESFLQNSSNYKTKLNYRVCNTSSTFFPKSWTFTLFIFI